MNTILCLATYIALLMNIVYKPAKCFVIICIKVNIRLFLPFVNLLVMDHLLLKSMNNFFQKNDNQKHWFKDRMTSQNNFF